MFTHKPAFFCPLKVKKKKKMEPCLSSAISAFEINSLIFKGQNNLVDRDARTHSLFAKL